MREKVFFDSVRFRVLIVLPFSTAESILRTTFTIALRTENHEIYSVHNIIQLLIILYTEYISCTSIYICMLLRI